MKYGLWLLTAAGVAGFIWGLNAYRHRRQPSLESPDMPDNIGEPSMHPVE